MVGNDTELDKIFSLLPDEEDHTEAPRRRRRTSSSEGGHHIRDLNLTAMMDMMTILLVFLLKNYATSPENVTISDELEPPRSTAKILLEPSTTVTIAKGSLLVDDKPIAKIDPTNWSIVGDTGNDQTPIASLSENLDRKVADMKLIADKGGPAFEGKILLVADESIPYSLMMRVLYTAGVAQFSQYKLVVRSAGSSGGSHG